MIENLANKSIKKIDLTTRDIYLNQNIDSASVEEATLAIRDINTYDNEQELKLKEYERLPITVVVDSYGGNVYDGLGLVNVITSSRTPIHTYCYSKAMSMGFLIFISGHKRYIHEHATLMHHQISGGAIGTNEHMKIESGRTDNLNKQFMKLVEKRTNITKKQMKKKNKEQKDWFIVGEKAIELNAADELIEDVI